MDNRYPIYGLLFLAVLLAVCLNGCGGGIVNAASGAPDIPGPARAVNDSTATLCAEEDNVKVFFFGETRGYIIEATHPTYSPLSGSCEPDFTDCPPPQGEDYPFNPGVYKLLDDGITVVEAVREEFWWLPDGMVVSVDHGTPETDIHYIRISRKIADEASWPQFLVLYMDGNLRIKPHPPVGMSDTCFGSSVIIGPNAVAERPVAEIVAINYDSATDALEIGFKDGNSAILSIINVDRTQTLVKEEVTSPTALSFVTFRSMFVSSGNADVDSVEWIDPAGVLQTAAMTAAIMDYPGGDSIEWFFYRAAWSKHNTPAPDIRIKLQ